MTSALRLAVLLIKPSLASWLLKDPDKATCASGCRVIEITGHRIPVPNYTLRLTERPSGRAAKATLRAPKGTPISVVASALLLKCTFLLNALHVPPRRRLKGPVVPRPRRRRPAPHRSLSANSNLRHRHHTFGIGPAATFGLTKTWQVAGFELLGFFRIARLIALRASIGWLFSPKKIRGVGEFRALPLTLLVGARWTLSRWRLGVYGGISLLALFLDQENPTGHRDMAFVDMSVGASIEARVSLRVHRRISIGLSVRPTYVSDDIEAKSDDGEETLFIFPHFLLSVSLDVSLRF